MSTAAESAKTHRSWYLPADVARVLAETVEELHHGLRAPKHRVLGAIIGVGLAHRAEIEARLAEPDRKDGDQA